MPTTEDEAYDLPEIFSDSNKIDAVKDGRRFPNSPRTPPRSGATMSPLVAVRKLRETGFVYSSVGSREEPVR
jgi:hypothetical protein